MSELSIEEQIQNEINWVNDLSNMIRGAYEGTVTEYEVIKFIVKNWYSRAYASAIRDHTRVEDVLIYYIGLESNISKLPPNSSGSIWWGIFDYDTDFDHTDDNEDCDVIASHMCNNPLISNMRNNYPDVLVPTDYHNPKPEEPIEDSNIWPMIDAITCIASEVRYKAKLLEELIAIMPLSPSETLLPKLQNKPAPTNAATLNHLIQTFDTRVTDAIYTTKQELETEIKSLIKKHFINL